MGSPGGLSIDPTVGGLVWVRRRNGSWWPGQIIEVDESSEDFMGSPKSGTPIKLLGRDDVSVDWYNLEKSKRVKPFRCGDYDVCIEKAKIAASKSNRKAVKYARREDAIIKALEIEMENPNSDIIKPSQAVYMDEKVSGFNGTDTSVQDLIEDPNQARPRRTPYDSEDDGTEGVKRMRGLNDLGMGSVKRKRTQVGHVHEFLKRKDRRRPLSKVLESTSMVSAPVISEYELNRSTSAAAMNKSDNTGVLCENGHPSESLFVSCKQKEKEISSLSIPEKGFSEKLFDVPLVPRRTHLAGTASIASSQKPRFETSSFRSEELHEIVSTSSGAADVATSNSQWRSKRKRNARNIVRIKKPKMANVDDNYNSNLDDQWGWSFRNSTNVAFPEKRLPYRQSRSIMNPKYGPEFSMMNHHEDCDIEDLYNVYLDVKVSSRPQHVPYISLRSKLTGQPIIGHPITVEILEEGSADDLVRGAKRSSFETSMFVSKHLKSHRVSPVKSTRFGQSAASSKKIRKLSSIKGYSGDGDRSLVGEKIMGPVVACVPLKVAFSRLNASLKGLVMPPRRVSKSKNRSK